MIYDILLFIIVALFVIIGIKRGLAASLFNSVMSFLSYILATWVSKLLAGWVYATFVYPAIRSAVEDTFDKLLAGTFSSVEETIDNLPFWLKLAFNFSGQKLNFDWSYFSIDITKTAANFIDAAVRPVITGFLGIVLTIVVFLVLFFVLRKLLKKPLLSFFKLPVIKTVNRIFGGIFGAVEGIIVVWMLAFLLKLILPYIDSKQSFLNESTIYNSFIFYYFYSGNIFTALSSWIA